MLLKKIYIKMYSFFVKIYSRIGKKLLIFALATWEKRCYDTYI